MSYTPRVARQMAGKKGQIYVFGYVSIRCIYVYVHVYIYIYHNVYTHYIPTDYAVDTGTSSSVHDNGPC